jgi:nitrite reductase/ring-hydroxylating ferredoxin subunit
VTHEPLKNSTATRRGVLAGVGLVGLAGVITACGSSSASSLSDGAGATTGGATTGSGTTGGGATAAGSTAGGATSGAAGALASTSEIPVGSGMIFAAQQVVVTQPTAGDYKAFTAVCTHMGCIVNQISDGTIDCPCHGSEYSIKTGAVVRGPAPLPLAAKKIKITGDSIFLE